MELVYAWLECAITCCVYFSSCVYYNTALSACTILPAIAYITGQASAVSTIITYVLTHVANNGTLVISLLTSLNAISLAGFPLGSALAYA